MGKPPKSDDRLFVPLSAEPFSWFLHGSKTWELRRYGRQYTERHVYPGREVELRLGYRSRLDSLRGRIVCVVREKGLDEFFRRVYFRAVVPMAKDRAHAVAITSRILRVRDMREEGLIGFNVALTPAEIPLAEQYLPEVLANIKTSTVRRGRRHYPLGPASFSVGGKRLPICITGLRHTSLDELTARDAASDGFASVSALKSALRSHYSEMKDDDIVTVVSFVLAEDIHGQDPRVF